MVLVDYQKVKSITTVKGGEVLGVSRGWRPGLALTHLHPHNKELSNPKCQ
jgi:hypothetical protein